MTVDVVLANPPWELPAGFTSVRAGSRWPHTRKVNEQILEEFPFPFLLAYTTALLNREGLTAVVMDCLAQKIGLDEFIGRLQARQPRLLVLETSSPSFAADILVIKKIKAALGVPLALAGPHPTFMAEDILTRHPEVDYCLLGEYEYPVLALAGGQPAAEIPGLACRHDGRVRVSPPASGPGLKPLDDLPYPERDQLNVLTHYNENFCRHVPNITLVSSRGCPHRCIFCLEPVYYAGYRARAPEKVVDEMFYLRDRYHPREFYFDDSSFTVGEKRVRDICRSLIDRQLGLPWSAMGDGMVGSETLKLMRRAGCGGLKFGVESADPDILKQMKKPVNLDKVRRVVAVCRSLGIRTHATYAFGGPGENDRTIEHTLRFAIGLNTDTAQFSCMIPFPGTPLFDQAQAQGWLLTTDFSRFDGLNESVIGYPDCSGPRIVAAVKEGKRRLLRNIIIRHPAVALKGAFNLIRREGLGRFWEKLREIGAIIS
ncbi:MAG: radical SAM protein [Deltaproteobacteria bacterium]|nr:radical SAM protein [Deltaproteobacteria bacterium]